MRNCAGVYSRGLRRYCSSRISGGTHSAVQTSFTTIETKRYSSGRKNTPANIGKHISNLMERTSRWSRRHFRSALRNPGCLRSPRMGNRGGGRAAMYGGNLGRYLARPAQESWLHSVSDYFTCAWDGRKRGNLHAGYNAPFVGAAPSRVLLKSTGQNHILLEYLT